MSKEEVTFCYSTLFDSRYGAKGMSLLESIHRKCEATGLRARAFVLAMDDAAEHVIREHKAAFGVHTIHTMESLFSDPVLGESLKRAKEDRSYREFCWSLASIYTDHVMRMFVGKAIPKGDLLCYVDSDVYWFDSPAAVVRELDGMSVGCQPHAFPAHELKRLGPNGKYNIGVTAFRADLHGTEALSWWCNNVLAWCHEGDGDRARWQYCGDQGYMDGVAQLYESSFREFKNVGLYVAPWNLCEHRIEEGPRVDGVPLVCFHMHEFSGPSTLSNYHIDDNAKRFVYNPFIDSFLRWQSVFDRLRR